MARRAPTAEAEHMDNTPPVAPPPPPTPPGDTQDPTTGPRVDRSEVADLGRLRRSRADRRFAGVAGGIARHLDIDPVIVRVVLVVLVFFGGAGLLLYAGVWLLVPEEGAHAQPLGLDDRSRTVALVLVGVLAGLALVGDWAGAYWLPWPLLVIALLVTWVLTRSPRDGTPGSDPRRRGPVLFWFTLALVATGTGLLGLLDMGGAGVPDPAYPALALGLVGTMLVVGAFWGRAGGLVLLGLAATVAMVAATAAHHVEGNDVSHAPTSAAQVRDAYDLHAGTMVVDLSGVQDVAALDGRRLEISAGIGELTVVLPQGVDVSINSEVGVGDNAVLEQHVGGLGTSQSNFLGSGEALEAPELAIEVHLGVGQLTVREK